ncbi:MAG: aminodeoxychorismate/anthranilate synthase component II [Desulfobacterota bacterium]|nr:aminodeoxychorismate/anthranilate synthase component II [Thermodesulfobacteriota bacterium]MDW8002711.1 aminodeoxychorismate/anthranilate synthase component II [Deltaproteobacteria bacterium]
MILLIDNYDSFTYNLFQYLGEMTSEILVMRNDRFKLDEIEKMRPSAIVISPGPKRPEDAGLTVEVIKRFGNKTPILGVCLGHQCIGYAFGARIVRAKRILHGKTSFIYHDEKTIFKGLKNPFRAVRYHSLVIDESSIDDSVLEVTAKSEDGEVMGIRHRECFIEGVQFHPESILTESGKKILENFLEIAGVKV